MLGRAPQRAGRWVFLAALAVRLVAIAPATWRLTPYSQADPVTYARVAAEIAGSVQRGALAVPDVTFTNRIWGLFLAPFWLLPGPSAVYARLFVAVAGALAVYNVYVMGAQYHSRRAGVAAALPMALLPAHVLVDATLMRDAVIVCGLSTTARVIVAPPDVRSSTRYALAGLGLAVATILRTEQWPLYVLVLVVGVVTAAYESDYEDHLPPVEVTAATFAVLGGVFVVAVRSRLLGRLADYRRQRVGGDSQYLVALWPDALWKTVVFAPVLAVYFLGAPFLWMVSSVPELVASLEGLVVLGYAALGIWGVVVVVRDGFGRTAIPLLVGTVAGVGLYALVITNYGAATRLRQVLTWTVFLFGGVAVAQLVRDRSIVSAVVRLTGREEAPRGSTGDESA